MKYRNHQRWLALLLALSMMLGMSTTAYAASSVSITEQVVSTETETNKPTASIESGAATDDVDTPTDPEAGTGDTDTPVELDDAANDNEGTSTEPEADPTEEEPSTEPEADPTEEEPSTEPVAPLDLDPVSDFDTFLADLKQLESYASEYAQSNPSENATALVINFIRTGVERYTSSTWATLAGAENTAFTEYVAQQDAANETTSSALKDLEQLTLPNGDEVDLGHMFGTLDITYYATVQGMTAEVIQARADLGGWAGDTADMMYCAENVDIPDKVDTSETDVDILADAIREKYLGADYATLNSVDHSFTSTDVYGDMDAFYVASKLGSGDSISSILEGYFTSSLSDESRAAYFLQNRLGNVQTKAGIRKAVLDAYTSNTLIGALEGSYELLDLENHDTLQTACCYAFADYLFVLAGDENGTDPEPEPEPEPEPDTPENGYYTVFSNTTSTLAPGITQDITYALTTDSKQIVFYTATIDVSRDDVSIYANYNNNDASSWAMSRVSDQMAAAQAKHSNPDDPDNYIENYNAVLGVNADFYNMSNGTPSGALVMEGVEYHGVGSENFFAILKDGTPIIGGPSDYAAYKDQIQEAVGGSVFLVKDGKIAVSSNADYYNSRASRTCVGITADGKVVMMVLDGRQEPFSAGGSAEEIAQIMLEAGCTVAINLDGGGSTTFDAKQEGADEVTVVNRPSDGYERSVSSSLLVVSTAQTTNTFDHALITTDTDYLTVGSSLALTVSGVSSTGNAADLPENTQWVVVDSTIGSIEDDTFTAVKTGSTEIQLTVDGVVVGSKTLNVVLPDALLFTRSSIDSVYGEAVDLPIAATYNGNAVTINPADIVFELSNSAAGTISDFQFTGDAASGIRNVKVTAMIAKDYSIQATMSLALYNADEAKFDFDAAMFGDRTLAWNREVSNSTLISQTEDDVTTYTYYIDQADLPMVTDYTFALDMQKVEVPEQLVPLLQMVAGGDLENVTAWDILLQLAERVSSKTNVQVQINFDKNVTVDYSNLQVVNDYFTLTNAELDEESNTLTLSINWIKQSEAISAETANPIVIVSGLSLVPKDDAAWDENNCLTLKHSGTISYDIYLGASTLYSMASQTSFQEQYGIYPYTEPENTAHPSGGHFASTFRSFKDVYTLDSTIKDGWATFNGNVYYFQNNEPLTGIQKLPGYQDENNEYYYNLGEDGVYTGKLTGLFELEDNIYYAINGQLVTGWRLISGTDGADKYYYFDHTTKAAVDGTCSIGGHTYVFENHILTQGAWETDEVGIHYFWAGKEMQNEWFTVDGKQYFAYANTCAVATGIAKTLNHERTGEEVYVFDETGVWLENLSGFYDYQGSTYLVDHGIRVAYPGLIQVDGDYYYFKSSNTMVKDQEYYISKTNGLMAAGKYTFDADGKMVIKAPEEMKNGIVKESDDVWYYYVNDVKTYAGLIEIDGDYYYVNSSFMVIHGQSYFVSKTNGLMPQGTYEFDADGKLVTHETLNGIVKEDDDTWYYYVDGVKTYAGLIEIDGDYYYVNSSFKVIHNQSYFISKTNGLMPNATYEFDADGKMVIKAPEEMKNGIVKESDDVWYYYVNDVKTYAGLIEIEGDYYYVNSSFKVIHNQSYFISKTNGLKPQGTYEFDADGKLVVREELNGIVKESDDTWYYYVNGVKTYAGLIEIDGDYYYVNSSFKVIHNQSYFISKTNGLMPNATYQFDADGKMILE